MRKILLTMGHVPASLFASCAEQLRRTRTTDYEHYFVYHHYPMNPTRNRAALEGICARHGLKWLDPGRNLGLHAGLNWAVKEIGLTRDDLLLGVDPDTCPVQIGWDKALFDVVEDSKYGLACLSNSATPNEIAARKGGYAEEVRGGVRVYNVFTPCVISISAWRMSWVFDVGGFHEPCKFYGHIESAMIPEMLATGRRFAILRDFHEADTFKGHQDPEYAEWKAAHAFQGYDKNFDVFLRERYPALIN